MKKESENAVRSEGEEPGHGEEARWSRADGSKGSAATRVVAPSPRARNAVPLHFPPQRDRPRVPGPFYDYVSLLAGHCHPPRSAANVGRTLPLRHTSLLPQDELLL